MNNQLDIIEDLYQSIDNGREGKNIGISTGLPRLDDGIGGIQRKMYYLIFGGSGSGKTALALYSFIYRPLKDKAKDYTVVYFSLELSAKTLLAKMLCLYIGEEYQVLISYKDLMSWNSPLNDGMYAYVRKARTGLESVMDHFIIYDKSLNRDSFYHALREIIDARGSWGDSEDGRRKIYTPDNPNQTIVTVVDHLSLVTPKSGSTKKEEMDAVSAYAISLRERTGMSFVMLQQENRNSANMDRRKMDMTECSSEDLKDSGCSYNDWIHTNPQSLKFFNQYYDKFYHIVNGKKVKYIDKEMFSTIEALGLAVFFQDDGYKNHTGYGLATNCYTREEIQIIQDVLKEKFDLSTNYHSSSNTLYIPAKDVEKFNNIVAPYITEDCKYKLINSRCKTPLNEETPEKDNLVLNP